MFIELACSFLLYLSLPLLNKDDTFGISRLIVLTPILANFGRFGPPHQPSHFPLHLVSLDAVHKDCSSNNLLQTFSWVNGISSSYVLLRNSTPTTISQILYKEDRCKIAVQFMYTCSISNPTDILSIGTQPDKLMIPSPPPQILLSPLCSS